MPVEALSVDHAASLPADAPRLEVVVGWTPGDELDVDAVALLLGLEGAVRSDTDFVFYNQPADSTGAVRLLPRTHTAEGASERIAIDFTLLPEDVTAVALGLTVAGATPADLVDLCVHIDDADDGSVLLQLDTTFDGRGETALFAELRRRADSDWEIVSRAQSWTGGLAELVTSYGVSVEDGAEPDGALIPDQPIAALDSQVPGSPGDGAASRKHSPTLIGASTAAEASAAHVEEPAGGLGDDLAVVETRRLPPDPGVMDAIGHNHDLGTALADLVDNSVDAGAGEVRIRLLRRAGQVVRLLVVDDGRGIDEIDMDRAMSIGAGRAYGEQDLGHFGMGLKAAAFSQADGLTVVSRPRGAEAAGRRWIQEKARTDFSCDVLSNEACFNVLSESGLKGHGTVIRLDRLRRVPQGADVRVHRRYISESDKTIRRHLGTVFHRFLERKMLQLSIEVVDLEEPDASVPLPIQPLDPFGYRVSGAPGYPKTLTLPDGTTLEGHVWTPRSELVGFKFGTTRAAAFQGFYLYRNDRLLQVGGWNDIVAADNDLQLARVRIELAPSPAPGWRMSPQKDRVEWDATITQAITEANDANGHTWAQYLEDAREAHRRGRTEARRRRRTIEPGRGFAPELRTMLGDTFEHLPGERELSVRWRAFSDDAFLEVDRLNRTLWLNQEYRTVLNGGRANSLNDTPLLKATLYLLAEDLFQGHHLGPKDRDHLVVLQQVLTAAAQAEMNR
ncbi:TerD family protein [Kineococcus sp. R86509]|uniref:TerD family protein n=1 Tax=Kineococcus sp. R86509 TaxID=3093851 RepID=UPI0036D37673